MSRNFYHSLWGVFAFARRYSEGVILAIVLAVVVRMFVVSSVRIGNDVMSPTLLPGDYVLAYRLPFGVKVPFLGAKIGSKLPKRGRLVVFPCQKRPSVKCVGRAVGLPGDRIEVVSERLSVNGEMAEYSGPEAYRAGTILKEKISGSSHLISISGQAATGDFGPYIVPPGQVFILSDHRDLGSDSRAWGGLAFEQVEAEISFVWISWEWPIESNTAWPGIRWSRVFHSPD